MAGRAATAAVTPWPLRLLLDEHYSRRVAASLRDRGHDVVALLEVPGAAGLPDPAVYHLTAQLGRRVVTENSCDFRRYSRTRCRRVGCQRPCSSSTRALSAQPALPRAARRGAAPLAVQA